MDMLGYGSILKMLIAFGTDGPGLDFPRPTFCRFVPLHAIIGLLWHSISILLTPLLYTSNHSSIYSHSTNYEVFMTTAEKSSPTPHNSINRLTSPISPL
jgi:hypothetical protein